MKKHAPKREQKPVRFPTVARILSDARSKIDITDKQLAAATRKAGTEVPYSESQVRDAITGKKSASPACYRTICVVIGADYESTMRAFTHDRAEAAGNLTGIRFKASNSPTSKEVIYELVRDMAVYWKELTNEQKEELREYAETMVLQNNYEN
jgi:hypothetical protein